MKKLVGFMLILVLVMSALAGCGSQGGDNTGSRQADTSKNTASNEGKTTETPAEGAGASKPEEPVTLRFSFPNSSDAEKEWVADFEKFVKEKYPHVTIEWLHIPGGELIKKITIMLQANDIPDLILAQEITDFVKMEALEPLDDYLNSDKDITADHFNQAALAFSKVDGNIYSLPTLAVGYGLLVNTDIIGKAGIKLEDLKTWDDYLNAAKEITKDDVFAHAFAGNEPRFTFRDFYIAAASNGIMIDQLTDPANKSKLVELMEFYLKLKPYMIPEVQAAEWPAIHQNILDGRVAFIGTGTYFSGYLTGLRSDAINYLRPIPFPKGPSADSTKSLVANAGFAIFKESKNKDLSWKILKEALNEQFAAKLAGSINTSASTVLSESVLKEEVQKFYPAEILDSQMDILSRWKSIMDNTGTPMPLVAGQTEIERIYQEKLFKLLNGGVTPEKMVDEFIEEVKKVEEEFK